MSHFEAGNLHGATMIKELPVDDFRFLNDEEIALFDIIRVDPNGRTMYLFQVDLLYPSELQDEHNDLPSCPNYFEITKDILSDVTIELDEEHGEKFQPQKNLAPALENKEKCICHSSNLKFYIEQGLVLTKIHKVLSFTWSAWLAPYINFNTERWKMAVNSFIKDFYKLMSDTVCTYSLICYFMVILHSAIAIIHQLYMIPYTLYCTNNLYSINFTLIYVYIS